jgi:hypothetical protein
VTLLELEAGGDCGAIVTDVEDEGGVLEAEGAVLEELLELDGLVSARAVGCVAVDDEEDEDLPGAPAGPAGPWRSQAARANAPTLKATRSRLGKRVMKVSIGGRKKRRPAAAARLTRCRCRYPRKNYLVEDLSCSALALDGGVLGVALLLELDDGLDGLAEGGVERDMLLEPLVLESLRESCDEDDCDGVEEALLPGLFVRSQAASVSAPALRAMRSVVVVRVMVGVSLSGQETLSKHRANGISPLDQRVGRPKCRCCAPVSKL